ncbi:adenylate cyclase type 3 [Vanessa cardui]|uniref:adenylate cyclase type 3 n=1 Tax=Vanessa cardui TaxID=171605 RepID=UPI001F12E374|nr:adenylate cyclase type 3 [Vanessa cardui]XP_046961747.1 adenylate cyclase type 3 [Vanessa cardui]XP_046961748.1 adenylate cyclase type 3 [Vanessa cardui]XP_046961749.1 adenylate cyclase type 3 [Vanessa cardui]
MEKSVQARTLKKSACWFCFVPPWRFSDLSEEKLYLAYTQRQRQRAILRLLAIGVLFQTFAALVPGERDLHFAYALMAVALVVNLLLAAIYAFISRARSALNHVAWFVLWMQLLVSASRRLGDSYNELLGWAVVLQYFTLATLPFHFMLLIIYSILSFAAYLAVQYYNASTAESRLADDFYLQQIANGCLLLGATLLGGTAYTVSEKQQRCSFQETKRSLRDKLTIEQQSKEQERLLLSVLPEHVAVQMRQDLGLIDTQFKKIYMSRHENVSILYADIVGFTAISSTYSAQDLVAILNELFARFDRLAEKYQQLRIKILGDCYYCISGAPVERPDHAVLCVHMGLSMVKAIKYVQQKTNSPVDMRVGIHTGAVLAGVLGQRQWQFDVYSRDVELANKMESSGMAGRVHVSEVTLSFLNDEFEVEPAHGERREEMLRQAGVKTYFIVRVLKPYQGSEDKSAPEGEAGEGGDAADALSDLKDDDEDSVLSPQDESKDNEDVKILAMLEEELVNRDDDKELADATTLCLTFKASDAEAGFARRRDPCPLTAVAPPLLLLPTVVALASFAVPHTWSLHAVYLALVLETGLINVVYYACYRYVQYKKKTISPYWKLTCGVFNIAMFVAANIAPLIICGSFETLLEDDLRDDAPAHSGARRCIHPSYYYHVGAGALCGALWVSPLGGGARAALLAALAAAHALPAALHPALLTSRPTLDRDPFRLPYNATSDYDEALYDVLAQIHTGRHILMLLIVAIALLVYNRYSEALERARHSRGERMRAQAEQAGDLRRRNQALVHNVLPPHVARHFMGARHHHADLYSQSYAEVGVLFASMPNFTEFYSEETVNNQGLECLRFLNEVISDFDLLLEDAKFSKDIIKIKTISSTYMAASGLNPTRQMQPSDGVLVRWAHLACLVEFALELQRVLAAINEQSFNHFVLRMGVNHGPITAGVIGARKPHYDIWGNTVNVASRMESTGKAGCIQVTEETCHILQSFGYYFEQRGLVAVKGKGQLMTYYLQGKREGTTDLTDNPVMDEQCEASARDALLANGGSNAVASSPQQHSRGELAHPLLPT